MSMPTVRRDRTNTAENRETDPGTAGPAGPPLVGTGRYEPAHKILAGWAIAATVTIVALVILA